MRTSLGSSLISAAIAALIWIVISLVTGAGVLFAVGGGILVGVVVLIIGYGFRRLIWERRKPPA